MRYSPTRFPAPIVRNAATADFLLTETHYGAGTALSTHEHEYSCLVVVIDGTFNETIEGKNRVVGPGTVIVRPAGEPHSNSFDGGGRCLNVEMRPQWLNGMRELAQPLDRSASHTGATFAILGRRLHSELMNGDDLSALTIESLVLDVFADAIREKHAHERRRCPRWLMHAKARIDDDATSRITLTDLAAEAGVHPVHLATVFREQFGRTVATYVRHVRVELACRKLLGSDAPIADIALATGFSDQSHLCRRFKQTIGLTPAAYRAASRKPPACETAP